MSSDMGTQSGLPDKAIAEPVRGWIGDKGTIVLSASVHLPSFPGERFHVFDVPEGFIGMADGPVYDAIRRLQESESRLRVVMYAAIDHIPHDGWTCGVDACGGCALQARMEEALNG